MVGRIMVGRIMVGRMMRVGPTRNRYPTDTGRIARAAWKRTSESSGAMRRWRQWNPHPGGPALACSRCGIFGHREILSAIDRFPALVRSCPPYGILALYAEGIVFVSPGLPAVRRPSGGQQVTRGPRTPVNRYAEGVTPWKNRHVTIGRHNLCTTPVGVELVPIR